MGTGRQGDKGIASALVVALLALAGDTRADSFYMGADVSLLTFMQQKGKVFKANGVAATADKIFYDAGANLFRLRLFVNPQTTYTNSNAGAIQTQSYVIALAQQIKANAPQAKLLLDLHYSDTWADPGHQALPAAWTGQNLATLESTVQSYTSTTLAAFKSAGVMPDMVQVGNEINSGMLFPTGQLNFDGTTSVQQASWQNFGGLINAAIQGVRDAQGSGPKIQVAIHFADGALSGGPQFLFNHLSNATYGNVPASSYDIQGVSYYPDSTDDLANLKSNLTSLANSFNKKIMVLETNAPWESTSVASDPTYAETPAGQLAFMNDLRNVVANLPNGNGQGVVYWYPESVPVSGSTIYHGGATALFDGSGNALPALAAFYVPEPSLAAFGVGIGLIIRGRRRAGCSRA